MSKRKTIGRKNRKLAHLENIQRWVDEFIQEHDLQANFESFVKKHTKTINKGKLIRFHATILSLKNTLHLIPAINIVLRWKKPLNLKLIITFLKWQIFIQIG